MVPIISLLNINSALIFQFPLRFLLWSVYNMEVYFLFWTNEKILVIFLLLLLIALWSENIVCVVPILWYFWYLLYSSVFLEMFHLCLKRMCALQLLSTVFISSVYFIALHRYCIFLKNEYLGNPALSKSISAKKILTHWRLRWQVVFFSKKVFLY